MSHEDEPLSKKIKTGEQEISRAKFEESWENIERDQLNISFKTIIPPSSARGYFGKLEAEVEYLSGDLAKVKVFGKVYNIPRKQAAYGDDGVNYRYSGTTITAKPWTHTLAKLRDLVAEETGYIYNFALVNRYKDGDDKMGFHKDDERELCRSTPIASLTLGAERDFIFKHQDKKKLGLSDVKLPLTDGLLLLMKEPTNQFWYHSIPTRRLCKLPRINITFRKIVQNE